MARGSFENNFKKTSIMIGGNRELSDPSKFTVCLNNYAEGTEKKDLVTLGNDMVDGSYSRGVLTAKGGYLSKQLWAAYQTIRKPTVKDCGSKKYQEIPVTKDNVSVLTYRYVLIGNKLVKTDLDLLTKYIGKTLKFRSPAYCKSNDICMTCMGEFLDKLGIEDPGLVINRVGSKVMMGMMKKFHDKTVKTKTYNIEDYIEEL